MSETPEAVIREALGNAWHSSGCGTQVGPEDGGGYCTPGCVVYGSQAALDSLLAEIASLRTQLQQAETALRDWQHEWDGWQRGGEVQLNAGYSPVSDDALMSACAKLRADIAALAAPPADPPKEGK